MDKKEIKKLELHGGNIYKLNRERGLNSILDYSSNINPFGLPSGLKEIIYENMDNILIRYPDPEYIELREKIAKINDVKLENIILGNGATEIIFLYMKVIKAKKVLIVSPTFAEYERALQSNVDNLEISYFELKEEDDFIPNFHNLEEELDKNYDLLVMCNPNNPTGKYFSVEIMEKILEKCNKMDTKLFIDEAFIEFVENWEERSIIKTNIYKENLFVLRAFTKFFAIPGLRLGYGICFNSKLYEEMMLKKEPWSINNIADLTGKIVLDDIEYMEKTKNWIREEKKYFFEKLSEIKGIKPYKTEVNFILVKIDENLLKQGLNVEILREKMIEKGILIRNASNFVYLDNSYFRLAIKDRENNNKVINKLKNIIEKYK